MLEHEVGELDMVWAAEKGLVSGPAFGATADYTRAMMGERISLPQRQ